MTTAGGSVGSGKIFIIFASRTRLQLTSGCMINYGGHQPVFLIDARVLIPELWRKVSNCGSSEEPEGKLEHDPIMLVFA